MIEEHSGEAIHHLQQAVLELIGAARAGLDLIEDVVNDPAGLTAVVETVVSNLRGPSPSAPSSGAQPADNGAVQHIPVR
jgi:hypothetical protein